MCLETILMAAGPVASLAGGIIGANAAGDAADTQSAAARYAADLAAAQGARTRADLTPFRTAGEGALNALVPRLASLTSPITFDQATLEATPGYQFTRDQGLKAVQSSAASRGLGVSGAALKGASRYATGLADSTYNTRFGQELSSRQNAYNMLKGVADLGENAAAQTGSLGQAATTAQTNALTSGAAASAAGDVGAANALTNALNGGVNSAMNYYYLSQLLNRGGGGNSTPLSGGTNANGTYRY